MSYDSNNLGLANFYDAQQGQNDSQSRVGYQQFQDRMWTVDNSTPTTEVDGGRGLLNLPPDEQHGAGIAGLIGQLNNITGRLTSAMRGNESAVSWLREEYRVENDEQRVTLPKDLVAYYANKEVEAHGGRVEEFDPRSLSLGVQTITSDEQYSRLRSNVERLKQYRHFEDADLHLIDYGRGKKVAIVVFGQHADADLANSVWAAENAAAGLREQLQVEVQRHSSREKDEPLVREVANNELQRPNASPAQQQRAVRELT